MKTMLIFIAIVLAGILAGPLFDAIASLSFSSSTNYNPQGGSAYGDVIVGFIVTVLLLAVFLTALIVAACKIPNGWVLTGVWAAIILLFATYPTIHYIKESPYKNRARLYKMLEDGAPDEKIKPLAGKAAKGCSGCVFEQLVRYFKFDMAREILENGYDISESSSLLSDMVKEDDYNTDTEFTRAVFLIENGADVNAKTIRGTPIFHAIGWGNLKSVKLLLDNGADINIRNQEGDTPLSWAKKLRESTDINIKDQEVKADALRERDEIIAVLLKYGAIEDNE